MPIHDQGYRRYGGQRAPRGRAWLIIARTGVRTLIGRRAFIGLLLVSWVPVRRPRGPALCRRQPAPGGVSRADSGDVPSVPQPAGRLPVLHHRLCRRRAHRQRQAGQRPADLPLQAVDPHRVRLRQAGHSLRLPAARHLGAGAAAAGRADSLCRELHVSDGQPLPVSRDHAVFLHPGVDRGAGDAGAVVALEEQPLRRHPLRGAAVFHAGHLRGAEGGHRQHAAVMGVGAEQPRSAGKRHLQAARALRHAGRHFRADGCSPS